MSANGWTRMKEGDLYSLATARRIVKNSDPGVSLFIWGPPGVGKSTMVREVTEELGIGLLDVRAAQLESIDLRGFPVIDPETNLASWKAFMNVLPHPGIHGERGILFLDELNLATLDVQKACYQLINDRRVGDYAMPEGWRIIAAGNELEHAEGAIIEMPHPLKNRFQHITVEAPTSPEQRADMYNWFYRHAIHPSIISFLKFRPDAVFDMSNVHAEHAYPTPRSWHKISIQMNRKEMGLLDDGGRLTDDRLYLQLIAEQNVGKGRAYEFVEYVTTIFSRVPDPVAILERGLKRALEESAMQMPDEGDAGTLFALCTSVVAHLKGMCQDPGVVDNFYDFIFSISHMGEFAMLTVQEAWAIDEVRHAIGRSKSSDNFKRFAKEFVYLVG